MMTWVKLALALLDAIPLLKRGFESLMTAYVQMKSDQMARENREAIRKALETHDQREIERLLGSKGAGKPTGVPGAVIRDSLPGVKP